MHMAGQQEIESRTDGEGGGGRGRGRKEDTGYTKEKHGKKVGISGTGIN